MLELPKITWVFVALVLSGIVLNISTTFTGLSLGEAVRDKESLTVAISFPVFLWALISIPTLDILRGIMTWVRAGLIAIWGYFAYQYLVHFEFPPANMNGDISWAINWVMTHKLMVVIILIVINIKRAIGSLSYRLFNNTNPHQDISNDQ